MSWTKINLDDYPGLKFFLEGYKQMEKIRMEQGLPVSTFEGFMKKRFYYENESLSAEEFKKAFKE